jgi:hypothetical protein
LNKRARSQALTAGRRIDSARRHDRVSKAIDEAAEHGDEISASAIARRAGVDRSFLYRHRDLLERVHVIGAVPSAAMGPAVSRASLQADLLNSQQRSTRLADRVRQLERRLSEALGDQIWQESGLGASENTACLQQQIVTLEQQALDLRLQLQEREDDLAGARAANRELMTRLNIVRPV